jgi:hypothetical protein
VGAVTWKFFLFPETIPPRVIVQKITWRQDRRIIPENTSLWAIQPSNLKRALRRRPMLDLFTFLVMFVIVAAVIFLAFKLGGLPGKIAEQRHHPQAPAVNVCGWLGLLTLGILWFIAMIWAFMGPAGAKEDRESLPGQMPGSPDAVSLAATMAALSYRIELLETEVRRLQEQHGESELC